MATSTPSLQDQHEEKFERIIEAAFAFALLAARR